MRTARFSVCVLVTAVLAGHGTVQGQTPMSTAFTCQGQLKEAGQPVNGLADFKFTLWDAGTNGNPVGGAVTLRQVEVVNGLFTVQLYFGSSVFGGDARWLEAGVRPFGNTDPYTVLSPRQRLNGTPYALYALSSPDTAWAPAQGGISYFGGDIGIGTDVPLLDLQVHEDLRQGRALGGSSLGASVLNLASQFKFFYMKSDDVAAHLVWDSLSSLRFEQVDQMHGFSWERMRIITGPFSKVGIGTTDPQAKLHVDSTGTTYAPVLHLEGGGDASPTGAGVLVVGSTSGGNIVIDGNEIMARDNGVVSTLYLNHQGGDVAISANGTGNVGIGTVYIPAGVRLAVDGKVLCEELEVQLSSSWPDYVFEKDYKLMSLGQLEEFVQTHRHLPKVPSADSVASQGLPVGKMQATLLEKVEELTLHVIDLNKQNEALRARVQLLESRGR